MMLEPSRRTVRRRRLTGAMLAPPYPDGLCMNRCVRVGLPSLLVLGFALAACQSGPSKEELEAAKHTIDCMQGDERIIIRFEEGEARLLLPDGTRVILYQIATGSGIRYLNGAMELRGKGLDLDLTRDYRSVKLTCKQYEIPAKKE